MPLHSHSMKTAALICQLVLYLFLVRYELPQHNVVNGIRMKINMFYIQYIAYDRAVFQPVAVEIYNDDEPDAPTAHPNPSGCHIIQLVVSYYALASNFDAATGVNVCVYKCVCVI